MTFRQNWKFNRSDSVFVCVTKKQPLLITQFEQNMATISLIKPLDVEQTATSSPKKRSLTGENNPAFFIYALLVIAKSWTSLVILCLRVAVLMGLIHATRIFQRTDRLLLDWLVLVPPGIACFKHRRAPVGTSRNEYWNINNCITQGSFKLTQINEMWVSPKPDAWGGISRSWTLSGDSIQLQARGQLFTWTLCTFKHFHTWSITEKLIPLLPPL